MKALGTILFACLVLADAAVMARGQDAHAGPEQKVFTESSIERPVVLSPAVLKVILDEHPAKETLAILNDSEKADPSQFFRAAEVHLDGPDEVDLVVVGVGKMKGSDTTWFWVVRSAHKDPDLALFCGGDSLEVLDTKNHAYKDLRAVWMSPTETETTVYEFNGTEYEMRKANNFKILTPTN